MPALLNISNVGLFSAQSDNRGRIDHNNVDNSTSNSWSRPRGHRSKGKHHGGGHKGHSKDC